MASDSAYADQSPIILDTGAGGSSSTKTPEYPTLVDLLSQDTAKPSTTKQDAPAQGPASTEDREKLVKALNELLSNDTKTSNPYLPILDLLGVKEADLGTKKTNNPGGSPTDLTVSLPDAGGPKKDGGDSAVETSAGGSGGSYADDDEPAAVRKNREKYNANLNGGGGSNPSDYSPNRPDNTPDNRPEVNPDDKKPEPNIESRYDQDRIEEAVRLAKENNLPLVVHVGASWCGPCRGMENNAWPGVEKDAELNKKAIYLHIDVDKAKELEGAAGELAKAITDGVESLPTIKVMTVGEQGGFNNVDSHTGGMSEGQLKAFIRQNLK